MQDAELKIKKMKRSLSLERRMKRARLTEVISLLM
jgi:hypothetical protein